MKRYLYTLAVAACLSTPLLADYLVIRINLGSEASSSADNLSGNNNQGGLGAGGGIGAAGGIGGGIGKGGGGAGGGVGLGGGGGVGLGGGSGGRGPAGLGGAGGPAPGMGGGGSGGRGPAGVGGLGNPGNPGGVGGVGGIGGVGGVGGPGGGGSGGRGPAGQGGFSQGGLGNVGGQGNQGLGNPGGIGGIGGIGGPGGNQGNNQNNPNDTGEGGLVTNKGDLFIVATEVTVTQPRNLNKTLITHKWGSTVLDPKTMLPERATMQVIKVEGLESRFAKKRNELIDGGNKQFMKLADWMLENWNMPAEGKFNMQARFEAYLTEMNSLAANLSAGDRAKLEAMQNVRSQLGKAVIEAKEEHALIKAVMTKLGKDFKVMQKGHFAIYHGGRDDGKAENKLARLESAYAGIMYWFALQGRPLNIPNKQMVCVLVDTVDKFKALHKMFDDAPLYSDGFFSPLDNITILAPTRVDPSFEKFFPMAQNADNALKAYNLNFQKLLADRMDRPHFNPRDEQQKQTDIITGQIFAIASKAAEDEGNVNTATYEAFRQITAATGFMPRTVIVPRFVKSGLASFFATPKSSGDHNLPALWSGIGGEHWLHLPMFKKMAEARKSGDNAEITVDEKLPSRRRVKIGKLDVMAVATDRVFEKMDKAKKDDQLYLTQKAEAESWALTFYLIKQRLPELKKYYDELAQMPRDMELSPDVLEQAFGRAFDLFDATGEKLDKNKVEKLERDWNQYMNFINLTVNNSEKAR